jgi:hypothetical protein
LAGQNEQGLRTIETIRGLEEKPDAKLTAGLVDRAILQARIDAKASNGPAYEAAFTRRLPEAVMSRAWNHIDLKTPAGRAGACIQRIQKALTERNVQLTNVLSDLSGVTGMRILRAIVAGERDGRRLAEFRDGRVQSSQETIAKSLEGTWRPEQLAILQRQLADWDHVRQQIAACDVDVAAMMKQLPDAEIEPAPPAATPPGKPTGGRQKNGRSSRNQPDFDLSAELKRVTGVDLTRIDGVKEMPIQTILTEAGLDMSKWATENHFVSWIGLAPRNDVSGGKVLKRKTRKVVCRLATAFRWAATTWRASDSYLGEQFRRLRTRLGAPKAITAMGAKLARLVYRMLQYGQEYVDRGAAHYAAKHREQLVRHLQRKAAQHGFTLVSIPHST